MLWVWPETVGVAAARDFVSGLTGQVPGIGGSSRRGGGSTLKVEELEKELAKGKIRPAYLLAGGEPLFRDRGMAALLEAVLGGTADDFNLERLGAEQLSPSAIEDSVRTLPVMADRRLVVVSDFDRAGRGEEAREKISAALIAAVKDLAAQEETVLVVTATKANSRFRWVKAFKDPAARVECDPPKAGKAVIAFIEAEARSQGLALEKGVARHLSDRIGPQLLVLQTELAKVGLLAGIDQPITRDHVMAATCDVADRRVWDLTDAICAGQTGNAVSLLGRMLAAGSAPEAVLGMLASHFRKLARVRGGGDVGGQGFMADKLNSQARRHSQRSLRVCLERIHATDAALKGVGSLSREMAIETLVIDLSG